jgi:hypothetical protein
MVLIMRLFLIIFLILLTSSAQAKPTNLPRFEDFSASVQKIDKQTVPAFSSKIDSHLQAAISAVVAKGQPTFAGHYTIAMIGCGTGCVTGSIVDLLTGKIVNFPFSVICKSPNYFHPVDFKPDSRLIIFKGTKNQDGSGNSEFYYVLKNNKLSLLKVINLPPYTGPPEQWDGK